jgi:hypothetical protein
MTWAWDAGDLGRTVLVALLIAVSSVVIGTGEV